MTVKFLPKDQGISAVKCDHRYDAVFTFSHQTDSRFLSSIYAGELYGFRNNIRLGAFISQYGLQENEGIREAEATGLIRHDIYYFTDMWRNPVNGVLEVIPDYAETTWSTAGAAVFPVSSGATKTERYPNHGQELYTLTSGSLGYDFINGVSGTSANLEFNAIVASQQQWFTEQTGREPSGFSFRNGQTGCAGLMYPFFVGGRNSSYGAITVNAPAPTWYGSNLGYKTGTPTIRSYFINYLCSSRAWDFIDNIKDPATNLPFTKTKAFAYVVQELLRTISLKGWYRDFCHWHLAMSHGTFSLLDEFLALVRSTAGANFMHTCSKGEALEYMFIRELCSQVMATQVDNSVRVIAEVNDTFKASLISGVSGATKLPVLNTPLSVRIDLSGTILAGKQVMGDRGKIRSLGSNVYVVELPFDIKKEGFMSVTLLEGAGGIFDETIPTATYAIVGETLILTTSIPTRAALFGVAAGGSDYNSQLFGRSNRFSTTHYFPYTTGKNYRAGIISEFNQCNLISIS